MFFCPVMYHFLSPFKLTNILFFAATSNSAKDAAIMQPASGRNTSDIIYCACCVFVFKEPGWLDCQKSLFHAISRQKKTFDVLQLQIILSL